jgi:hypothetical protein
MTPDEAEMQNRKIFLMKLAMLIGTWFAGWIALQLMDIASLLKILIALQK